MSGVLLFQYVVLRQRKNTPSNLRRTDTLRSFEHLKSILRSEPLANINAVSIDARIVTVCVILASELVEKVKTRRIVRITFNVLNKLAMLHDLAPLLAIHYSWAFCF